MYSSFSPPRWPCAPPEIEVDVKVGVDVDVDVNVGAALPALLRCGWFAEDGLDRINGWLRSTLGAIVISRRIVPPPPPPPPLCCCCCCWRGSWYCWGACACPRERMPPLRIEGSDDDDDDAAVVVVVVVAVVIEDCDDSLMSSCLSMASLWRVASSLLRSACRRSSSSRARGSIACRAGVEAGSGASVSEVSEWSVSVE